MRRRGIRYIAVAVCVIGVTVTVVSLACGSGRRGGGGGANGGGGRKANLFVVASGGSPSCSRSSTKITYRRALRSGHVCGPGTGALGYSTNGWNNACKAAAAGNTSAGTVIGVKAGTYAASPPDGALVKDTDCSGGLGAAVNPNAADQGVSTGTTAAWAKYVCADGTSKNVHFKVGGIGFHYADFHLQIKGSCFDFNSTIFIGAGGGTAAQRTSDLQVIGNRRCGKNPASRGCLHMFGLEIKGGKNILFENVNYGPSVQCGKNGAKVPAALRCDPRGPSFESQFSRFGAASPGCSADNSSICGGTFGNGEFVEAYIHAGDSSTYENVRLHNFYFHDSNAKQAGSGVHPGCFMMDNNLSSLPANNLVFDHIVCERIAAVGIQEADSGVTFENSIFSCPVSHLDQTSPRGRWDSCASTYEFGLDCRADLAPGCVVSNVLIRYNDFIGGGATPGLLIQVSPTYGKLQNVRIVGNVFGTPLSCGVSGVTYDSNTYESGISACGTNATTLRAGDPFVRSSIATRRHRWSENSLLNGHLDGSPTLPALTASGDLALDHDASEAPRGQRTKPGAYGS